jgi:adenylate kinase family enzyme
MAEQFWYRRIVVVGTSGSGKSTLAAALAKRLGVPHVELDALHWEPNWTEAKPEILGERVNQALSGLGWVVDGNYKSLRQQIWGQAELIVWLDYSLGVVLGRLVWRTVRRSLLRQELWSGNRESLRRSFFSRDSILWWALTTHKRRRRETTTSLSQPEYRHLKLVHFTNPKEAEKWLAGIEPEAPFSIQPVP